MIYLLDTSALLVFAGNEAEIGRVAPLFQDPENELLLCAVSVAEFGRKLREKGLRAEEAVDKVRDYVSLFTTVVPVDIAISESSLRLSERVSERLPLTDSLIAAAALERKAILVHKDKHLSVIPASLLPQINLHSALAAGSK